jgi:hypothetical protein
MIPLSAATRGQGIIDIDTVDGKKEGAAVKKGGGLASRELNRTFCYEKRFELFRTKGSLALLIHQVFEEEKRL